MVERISDRGSLKIDDVCVLVIAAANHALGVDSAQLVCKVSVNIFEVCHRQCLVCHLRDIPDGDVSGVEAVGHSSLSQIQHVVDVYVISQFLLQSQLHRALSSFFEAELLSLNYAIFKASKHKLPFSNSEILDGLHFLLELDGDGQRGKLHIVEIDSFSSGHMQHECIVVDVFDFEEGVVEEGVAFSHAPSQRLHII